MNTRLLAATAALGSAALLLAGCSTTESATENTESAATSSATAADEADNSAVTLEDGVVRAKEASEEMPMTAIFGTLRNNTDKDITVTGFTSSLGDARYELHKTENGVMSPVEGGFTLAAGESLELAPGGFHMMILDYANEIPAGETVDLTLETSAGEIEIPGVEVRSMLPGEENYGTDGEMVGNTMDHQGHEGHEGHEGH